MSRLTYATPFVRYPLKPVPGMTHAELVIIQHPNPIATLVLAPSCNGDGAIMVVDDNWSSFAEKNGFMLVGLSFASDIDALHNGTGYYYAAKGSGQLLLNAVDGLTGKPLPLLLYGFSGGAHFTARFTEWKPERVMAWCAYSAGWWDAPASTGNASPFGIIACGESDGRLGASLFYFKAGRAIGKPWLWVGVPGNSHQEHPGVAAFARNAFAVILDKMQCRLKQAAPMECGGWVDVEDKTGATIELTHQQPTLTGWLPDMQLFGEWEKLVNGEHE